MKALFPFAIFLLMSPLLGQDWRAEPNYGSVNLQAGFEPDPHRTRLMPGGVINLLERQKVLGFRAVGFVSEAPDLDLNYTAGNLPLVLKVEGGNVDTILLVNCPDGKWHYNDDTIGIHPQITFRNPKSGMYNIWVGTLGAANADNRVQLLVTEIQ